MESNYLLKGNWRERRELSERQVCEAGPAKLGETTQDDNGCSSSAPSGNQAGWGPPSRRFKAFLSPCSLWRQMIFPVERTEWAQCKGNQGPALGIPSTWLLQRTRNFQSLQPKPVWATWKREASLRKEGPSGPCLLDGELIHRWTALRRRHACWAPPGTDPVLPLIWAVTQVPFLASVPQFPSLETQDDNSAHLKGRLGGLKNKFLTCFYNREVN